MGMTHSQRVTAAVNFEKNDKIPYWDSAWGDFTMHWQQIFAPGKPIAHYEYYDHDINNPIAPDCEFQIRSRKILREDKDFFLENDGWGRIVRRYKSGTFSEPVEYLLKEKSDLDSIAFDSPDLPERFERLLREKNVDEQAGRFIFGDIPGVYCCSQFFRGESELLMDMMLDAPFCHALFAQVAEHLTKIALNQLNYLSCHQNGLIISDDMAGLKGPMFSPAQFDEFLAPIYVKMLQTLRNAGCRHVYFHCDGNMAPLIPHLLDCGFEGFNPLEPRCGLDLVDLRQKYPKAIFWGGVCSTDILRSGDAKRLRRHLDPLLEVAQNGGIILGFATIAEDVDPQFYDYYRNYLKENGCN